MQPAPPEVRRYSPTDDIARITALVHAAYAPHARVGLRYWGTHQSEEETARRFASGTGLLMIEDGQYIGTAIVRPPQPKSPVLLYREPTVWTLSQFCLSPTHKGRGYGKLLHAHAVAVAVAAGAHVLALDTAAPATSLIAMYESWGYELVGRCDWRPDTNYESVVMALRLDRASPTL